MWSQDGLPPPGSVSIRWVTDDTMLERVSAPPEMHLLCEECETSRAIVWTETDHEVLCARCARLLYPRCSTGAQHACFTGFKVRVVCRGDKSSAVKSVEPPDHYQMIITEDRWEGLGRDLREPAAVEAPKKNPINATSKSNRPALKFREGDVVVFDVEEILPDELQVARFKTTRGYVRRPPWRNREIWGRVMGTAHPRLGQYGHAVRVGDDHEPYYRVHCSRWVRVDPPSPGDAGAAPRTVPGHPTTSDPTSSGGKCTAYATELRAADGLFEQGHGLDRKKEQVRQGVQLPGGVFAPFAREKTLAWIRDRQLHAALSTRVFPAGELADGNQADADLFPTVVLLAESALAAPAEKRLALVRRRSHQLRVVLACVDAWLYERRCVGALLRWVQATFEALEAERAGAAATLQGWGRRVLVRARELALEHNKQEKLQGKYKFVYLVSDEDKAKGVTINGSVYFATMKECQNYAKVLEETAKKVTVLMRRSARADRVAALGRWRQFTARSAKHDKAPVGHFGEGHTGAEVARLRGGGRSGRGSPRSRTNVAISDVGVGGMLPSASASAALAAAAEGAASVPPPWHPAVGMKELPALPWTWCRREPNGVVVVDQPAKFKAFRHAMAGPVDHASWVIPGRVLCGAYLDGKARRSGRQPDPPSAVGQALVAGVGTIALFGTRLELETYERLSGLPPFEEVVAKEHALVRARLQGTAARLERAAVEAKKTAATLPSFKRSDPRHEEAKGKLAEALTKERLAAGASLKAQAAFGHFPATVTFLRLDVAEGDVADDAALVALLESVERAMRADGGHLGTSGSGSGNGNGGGGSGIVYLMSRLGHGRSCVAAACLLGRLYGLKAADALFRTQLAHDARAAAAASRLSVPAPQTTAQAAQVHRILALNDTLYGSTEHRMDGDGDGPESLVFPRLRGRGLPMVLPPERRPGAGLGGGGSGGNGVVLKTAGAVLALDEGGNGGHDVARPVLSLPRLTCPALPTGRDLRLSSTTEELAKGPFGLARALPPPAIGH